MQVACEELRSLASERYSSQMFEFGGFILKQNVGSMPHNSEINVPLIYADYYFVEAMTRYLKLQEKPNTSAILQ